MSRLFDLGVNTSGRPREGHVGLQSPYTTRPLMVEGTEGWGLGSRGTNEFETEAGGGTEEEKVERDPPEDM